MNKLKSGTVVKFTKLCPHLPESGRVAEDDQSKWKPVIDYIYAVVDTPVRHDELLGKWLKFGNGPTDLWYFCYGCIKKYVEIVGVVGKLESKELAVMVFKQPDIIEMLKKHE